MRSRNNIFLMLLFHFGILFAGEDSLKTLSFEAFMDAVKKYHPVARQADLQLQKGQASVLSARGGFDPKIGAAIDQKYFDDKQYFNLWNAGIKIPTWFGLELKSGYERNSGVFLNSENRVPETGLWYAGVSITLGQGLFIDERRFALNQAKIYNASTVAERRAMINELLYQAGKAYWEWFTAYNNMMVYNDMVTVARQRLDAVKDMARLGDRPFIDTLESGIQVQDRTLGLQQASIDYQNKRMALSVFLWYDNDIPLELTENVVPVKYNENKTGRNLSYAILSKLDSLVVSHPEITLYELKLENLSVEKKWKQEQLKPVFNLNYNPVTGGNGNNWPGNLSANNYKWGANFSMPLFLRKERGGLRVTELKIREAQLELKNKNLELLNKVRAAVNEFQISGQQVTLYTQTVKDYESLWNAERTIFNNGESSLFMINAREISYINAKLKLIELIMKNNKALLTTEYSVGQLGN